LAYAGGQSALTVDQEQEQEQEKALSNHLDSRAPSLPAFTRTAATPASPALELAASSKMRHLIIASFMEQGGNAATSRPTLQDQPRTAQYQALI
jgi:hypothetical protein